MVCLMEWDKAKKIGRIEMKLLAAYKIVYVSNTWPWPVIEKPTVCNKNMSNHGL